MQDVRCDGDEYIRKWERLPERMEYRLEASFTTSCVECVDVPICQEICVDGFVVAVWREPSIFT